MAAKDHLTLLVTAEGNPFTPAGFGNLFPDICDAAGLSARCTSHGLHKPLQGASQNKGATDHQLMAWSGWAQDYTKANRKRMAQGAAKLISGTGIGSPRDPVSQNDDQDIEIVRSGM
jgi:hypothetical protein